MEVNDMGARNGPEEKTTACKVPLRESPRTMERGLYDDIRHSCP